MTPHIAWNWGLAPDNWVCPVCHRDKMAIGIIDRHGEARYNIVVHHDHFRENWHALTHLDSGPMDPLFLNDPYLSVEVQRMAACLTAFADVKICGDCNNLDAAAKAVIDAPRDFSFGPLDLRRMFVLWGREPQRGLRESDIWPPRLAAYEHRKRMAAVWMERIRQVVEWKEAAPREDVPGSWAHLHALVFDDQTMRQASKDARARIQDDPAYRRLMAQFRAKQAGTITGQIGDVPMNGWRSAVGNWERDADDMPAWEGQV